MTDHRNGATYRAITGGRSPRTETRGWMEGLQFFIRAHGSKAAAARALDIPRRTLRNWLGEGGARPVQPPAERRDRIVGAVARAQRRARLTASREARLRKAKTITIEGVDRYDGEERKLTLNIGTSGSTGVAGDTMDRLINAYLAGGEALDGDAAESGFLGGRGRGLGAIIVDGITDQWYREFFTSTAPDWGVDIDKVTIR